MKIVDEISMIYSGNQKTIGFEEFVFSNLDVLSNIDVNEEVAIIVPEEMGSNAKTTNGPSQSFNRIFVAGRLPLVAKPMDRANFKRVTVVRTEEFSLLDYATKIAVSEGKRSSDYEEPSQVQIDRVQERIKDLKRKGKWKWKF